MTLTIGEVSGRTGLSVKTIRFYADEGLLPPSGRTDGGYRLFSEADLVRLDLIRTLRDAGIGLGTIRAVLARDMGLDEALRLRLRAIEAHVVSLQQVAAAIRADLRTGPDEDDLRRLHAVTRLSNEERRAVIERFYAQVAEGIPVDEQWLANMIDASAPQMPDDPTRAQLDAWIELAEIVSDRGFLESMRAGAAAAWTADFDLEASKAASEDAVAAARSAIDGGLRPSDPAAAAIVERFLAANAAANGREPDAAYRAELLEQIERHDPRAMRYWELVAIINGAPEITASTQEWGWLSAAIVHHLRT